MTDKELKKLNRSELLELMLEQSREIDRLQERNLKIESCGSIAEAAAEVNSLFHAAQRAADMYLLNVQRICAEKAAEAGKTEEWQNVLKGVDPAKKAAAAEDQVKKSAVADPDKAEKATEDEEAADEKQDS